MCGIPRPRPRPRRMGGNILTEYLVVLVALMAIWLTADVMINAMNTYYGNFAMVISHSTAKMAE